MTQLLTVVVGVKGIGAAHARALAAHPRAALVAVADIDAAAAARVADEHQAAAYTDYRELLDNERPNAVVCATPHHLHAPMALAALNAGAHTFVEKPLAMINLGVLLKVQIRM